MPFDSSTRKQLSAKLYSIPCKFFSYHRYFSLLNASSPEASQIENENQERTDFPLSEQIFSSPPNLGSYKLGDSTFYSLIENYATSGDFRSLEKVFDRMKRERRVFIEKIFIHVFKAYGRARLPEKAVELFDMMVDEFQCRPTVRSFNSVLNVLIHEGLFRRSLEFHSYVLRNRNISPNVLTCNLVIKAMCKLGLVDRAVETFRDMTHQKCTPDVFTYCTLMDGLCKENRIDDAVSLLDEMQIEGCFPNPATFNVLINGLCKRGDLARATKLVENMLLKGCVPNEVTYNTLIHGLCLKGKLDKAISLLDKMVSNKCIPNEVTYGTLINGLVKQGRVIDGARVLISMEERGHLGNEYIYSALVSGLFKDGKSEEALKLWKEMIEKGGKPNTVLYSALIDGLCQIQKVDGAKEIFSEMVNLGCTPNAFTYSSLIKGFFKTGNSNKALTMWKEMESNNMFTDNKALQEKINPPQDGREFLDELVVRLYKRGRIQGASEILEIMLAKFLQPKMHTWERVIQEICKLRKTRAGIDKCWSDIFC